MITASRTMLERAAIRKRSILVGPKLTGIVDLLECCKYPVRFSKLRMASKIKFKLSFIAYLKFCVEKSLIINTKTPGKKITGTRESWFVISPKGRLFLEMMQ